MDLAFIMPTSYLELYGKQGDVYLALAHLIDDAGQNEYARFHRREAEQGRRVILDNGLFEGAQVDAEALLRRAKIIGAQVVCAPDVLYDSTRTIKEFKAFVRLKQELGIQCDVMGIPQASDPTEWWNCFRFMDMSDECHIIGLSILSVPQSFGDVARTSGLFGGNFSKLSDSRVYLLRQLRSYASLRGAPVTPCHLLGLGDHLGDITYATRCLRNIVVSNDSSSAYIHGMHHVRYSRLGVIPGGKNHEKVDFDEPYASRGTKVGNPDYDAVQHNLNIARKLAHAEWGALEETV